MDKFNLYFVEALTNTHVGSGDLGFGIVDNLVQRNHATGIPVYNSSSLKGALNDHFSTLSPGEHEKFFGKEFDSNEEARTYAPGRLIFIEANLLTLPLRSTGKIYYNCTSPFVLIEFLNYLVNFNLVNQKEIIPFESALNNLDFKGNDFIVLSEEVPEIEDFILGIKIPLEGELKKGFEKFLKNLSTDNLAIFNNDIFAEICKSYLPVIARNKIDDEGESENLFYEEILPRKSVLYFLLGKENNYISSAEYSKFENILLADIIQFGGNYSIGYGFSKIHPLEVQ